MKVIIDTNFFLVPGKFGVDFMKELERFGKTEFCTLDVVVRELQMLAKGKTKDAKNARLGMEIIQKKGVEVIETGGGKADREIERLAVEGGYAVCTQDKELQDMLRNEGIEVFFLRQGKMLARL